MNVDEHMISGLPDPEAARRFLVELSEKNPSAAARLSKKQGLLSDVLTLVAFSPLLATTLLQNPDYFWWLERKRNESGVSSAEDLFESLARYSLTNSQIEPQVQFARFRRRELTRIYLRDIRRLATVPEITEELSNLADAILESALQLACREMDNRYGQPQHTDEKGRKMPATFCIVALGKLGSHELNYSSDIDLLFIYSHEGMTSGTGTREAVTNREYFAKLAEFVVKLAGEQTGEGAAYRVDLRLRPHGSLGALAVSVDDTVRYYRTVARAWERQVMIRSRGCAGDPFLFRRLSDEIEHVVFSPEETVESALANVRRSKEMIDTAEPNRGGFNVKLGVGGIREIEFLAQALQLAYGGRDPWLRSPHTLISLARLADRGYLTESELTELSLAYEFLRRTEHVLQMENGLQTHTVPDDPERRTLLAKRVTFASGGDFEAELRLRTSDVDRIFRRKFGRDYEADAETIRAPGTPVSAHERLRANLTDSIARSELDVRPTDTDLKVIDRITAVSPGFTAMLAANPHLAISLPDPNDPHALPDYRVEMLAAVQNADGLGLRLAAMRRLWAKWTLETAVLDIFERLSIEDSRKRQTLLAEAAIDSAMRIVRDELASKFHVATDDLPLAILALGKLGGRGLDYGSDLDLLMVYGDDFPAVSDSTPAEFYSRAVEVFVTAISSMTRDGNLYRVDLRLRPYGSKGLTAISAEAFLAYMRDTAATWEMLAFVKLRAVGGDLPLAEKLEAETRKVIHERAATIDPDDLKIETRRIRDALEKQHSRPIHRTEIDIKYGPGGLLDVYFAMRYLQLRHGVPDDPDDRSTVHMLDLLRRRGSLSDAIHNDLSRGYQFLSSLDHNLRLTIGRTTRIPIGNRPVLNTIATRMNETSVEDLLQTLTIHRLAIRGAFDSILTEP